MGKKTTSLKVLCLQRLHLPQIYCEQGRLNTKTTKHFIRHPVATWCEILEVRQRRHRVSLTLMLFAQQCPRILKCDDHSQRVRSVTRRLNTSRRHIGSSHAQEAPAGRVC